MWDSWLLGSIEGAEQAAGSSSSSHATCPQDLVTLLASLANDPHQDAAAQGQASPSSTPTPHPPPCSLRDLSLSVPHTARPLFSPPDCHALAASIRSLPYLGSLELQGVLWPLLAAQWAQPCAADDALYGGGYATWYSLQHLHLVVWLEDVEWRLLEDMALQLPALLTLSLQLYDQDPGDLPSADVACVQVGASGEACLGATGGARGEGQVEVMTAVAVPAVAALKQRLITLRPGLAFSVGYT